MKKKILKAALAAVIILSMVLAFSSCATGKLPDAESASGKIEGTGIVWSYSADTKTLDISGTGDIPNFESSTAVPWNAVRHSVVKVELDDGITAIGDYSFYFFASLKDIELPAGITSVGKYAFAFASSLESLTLPDAVTSVGDSCFEGCAALTSIFVPYSVTSIGARAFFACGKLSNAVIMAQISEIKSETFKLCSSLSVLCFNESVRGLENIADNAFEGAKTDFSKATFTSSTTGEATLTVKYVFTDGSTASPDYTAKFGHGESYNVDSPKLEGYTADKASVSGTISSDLTVTVTYKENAPAADPSTPADTNTPADEKEEEKEGITLGTIIALVILGVVIVGIAVLAIVMVRSDKKAAQNTKAKNAKPAQSNAKNKKK